MFRVSRYRIETPMEKIGFAMASNYIGAGKTASNRRIKCRTCERTHPSLDHHYFSLTLRCSILFFVFIFVTMP